MVPGSKYKAVLWELQLNKTTVTALFSTPFLDRITQIWYRCVQIDVLFTRTRTDKLSIDRHVDVSCELVLPICTAGSMPTETIRRGVCMHAIGPRLHQRSCRRLGYVLQTSSSSRALNEHAHAHEHSHPHPHPTTSCGLLVLLVVMHMHAS